MRLTIHHGELRTYCVPIRCTSHPKFLAQGDDGDFVLVFATSIEGAKLAAVDKMVDKYLRHRNIETTWVITGEPL
jgi:hypothetical protein